MKLTKPEQLLLCTFALSLAACGGGGKSPEAKRQDDTSTNSPQASFSRADAVKLANSEITAVAQFSGATSGDVTSAEAAIDVFNTAAIADLGLLATTTTTFFCNSADPQNIDTGNGSVTIATDDQDPVGRSTGDSVTTTFNQCNQFGSVISGNTANKINALTGDPAVAGPWVVDTTHTTDLTRTGTARTSTMKSTSSSKAESTDGVIVIRASTGQGSRSVTDAAGVATESSSRFSSKSTVDMNLQTKTSEFDMSSTGGTRAQSAQTITPISGPLNGAPTAGVIEIKETDAAAAVDRMVRVTMQSDGTALVEIDSDGDGVIDQTFTTPWFGGIGFGGGFGGGAKPGFGGGTGGGGGVAPPVTGRPPVASPGRLAPPTAGSPISPVPPVSGVPGAGLGGGFTRPPA